MRPDDVRFLSPFMGGGSGSGLRPQYQVVLAVLAARALERSVRLVLTRQQMYVLGYRPAMIQRIGLGARAGGTLDAITHEALSKRRDRRLCARMRDGRTCGRAQARSARTALAVLLGSRPERRPAVQQQEPARLLPSGRGSVRLEQALPRAALAARRQRLGWLR